MDALPVSPVRSNVIGGAGGPPQLSLSALNDSGISNNYNNVRIIHRLFCCSSSVYIIIILFISIVEASRTWGK